MERTSYAIAKNWDNATTSEKERLYTNLLEDYPNTPKKDQI